MRLAFEHEVAALDTDPAEVRDFSPELVINAVTLKYTICLHAGLRFGDEAPGCAGHNF